MPQKYCGKFEPPEQGARALQTDDRQTDGRAIAYSVREREFTFAKNDMRMFADDTKNIWSRIGGLNDCVRLQAGLNQLYAWSDKWLGPYSVSILTNARLCTLAISDYSTYSLL